jgi:DNA-binding transcriptional MerR regulator
MKTKRIKKTKSPATEKSEPTATAEQVQPVVVNEPVSHAERLLYEAEQEPDLDFLEKYIPAIDTLRNKGFSFRDIASWLNERDVETDHNAVYRVYTKNLTRTEAMVEEERERAESEKQNYLENQ